VTRLERRILAIEDAADCIAPEQLARRVQRLLDRSGWTGWSTRVSGGEGACGSISVFAGDGRRYISFTPSARPRALRVQRGAPRRVTELVYSAEHSLLPPLFAESGASCFTYEGLRDRIREVFAAEGVVASVYRSQLPRNSALDDDDGRWTRYLAGCAVVAAGSPGPGAGSAEVEVFQKP
jgi:hypothetical protein